MNSGFTSSLDRHQCDQAIWGPEENPNGKSHHPISEREATLHNSWEALAALVTFTLIDKHNARPPHKLIRAILKDAASAFKASKSSKPNHLETVITAPGREASEKHR
jgi:hypothetical protein